MRELTRFSADAKAELLAVVAQAQAWTGWTLRRVLHHLGLSKARYRDWTQRATLARLCRLLTRAPALDATGETKAMPVAVDTPADVAAEGAAATAPQA